MQICCKRNAAPGQVSSVAPPPLSRAARTGHISSARPRPLNAPTLWPNFYFLGYKRFSQTREGKSKYRVTTDQTQSLALHVHNFRLPSTLRGSKNRTRGTHTETAFLNTSLALSRVLAAFYIFQPGHYTSVNLANIPECPGDAATAVTSLVCVMNTIYVLIHGSGLAALQVECRVMPGRWWPVNYLTRPLTGIKRPGRWARHAVSCLLVSGERGKFPASHWSQAGKSRPLIGYKSA